MQNDPITQAPPVEIVVISLTRAVERRRAIQRQFDELGVPFSFFDAVDGKLGHPLFTRFDGARAKAIGEIPLTPGHLGCYASHYLVWEQCVADNRPLIVLEDDAVLFRDEFLDFLSIAPNLPASLACVRLFANKSRKTRFVPVFEQNSVVIGKFLRGHRSATGYFLTPDAARKLLRYSQRWVEPVDIVMDQFWANGVECHGVARACLTHDGEFESAIDFGVDTARERRGMMRARWRWYLFKGKLRRALHNLTFMLRHRQRATHATSNR